MDGLADDGSRLGSRYETRTFGQRWNRWWGALPNRVRAHGLKIMGVAGVCGVMIWESRNDTLGFMQLFNPGLPLAILGGVGACFMAMFLVHVMMDFFRARNLVLGTLFMFLATGAMFVVLVGVWSQLAADSMRRGDKQIENSEERKATLKMIRSYENDIRSLPETIDIGLAADRESLLKVRNQARQRGLPELDNNAGGDCDQQLKPFERGLCNQAADLRADIKTAEDSIAKRVDINNKLAAERAKLVEPVGASGVEHLQEMAKVFGDDDPEAWKMWANVVSLMISVILMLVAAFVLDLLVKQPPAKEEEVTTGD